MWDEFKDHPMRKDYVNPDDYEYEPTPHDEVLERAKAHAAGGQAMTDTALEQELKPTGGVATNPPEGSGETNYTVLPKPDSDENLLEVAMGPQHPSTHGVFRMDVVLDGERIVKLKPVFGYLHRNHEKIAENTTYLGSMPYTDRLDYLCSMTNTGLSLERGEACRFAAAGARGIFTDHYAELTRS